MSQMDCDSDTSNLCCTEQVIYIIACLIIYVDDIIIAEDDTEEITCFREKLFEEFKMKELKRLKCFEIQVIQSKSGYISQRKYIFESQKLKDIDCKTQETPKW